jgi:hypothetical protein
VPPDNASFGTAMKLNLINAVQCYSDGKSFESSLKQELGAEFKRGLHASQPLLSFSDCASIELSLHAHSRVKDVIQVSFTATWDDLVHLGCSKTPTREPRMGILRLTIDSRSGDAVVELDQCKEDAEPGY